MFANRGNFVAAGLTTVTFLSWRKTESGGRQTGRGREREREAEERKTLRVGEQSNLA